MKARPPIVRFSNNKAVSSLGIESIKPAKKTVPRPTTPAPTPTLPPPEVPVTTPTPTRPRRPRQPSGLNFDPTSLEAQVKAARSQGLSKLSFSRKEFDKLMIDPTAFLWEPQKKEVDPTFHFWYLRMAIHLTD